MNVDKESKITIQSIIKKHILDLNQSRTSLSKLSETMMDAVNGKYDDNQRMINLIMGSTIEHVSISFNAQIVTMLLLDNAFEITNKSDVQQILVKLETKIRDTRTDVEEINIWRDELAKQIKNSKNKGDSSDE